MKSSASGKPKSPISDSSLNQIAILRAMARDWTVPTEPRMYQIDEIAELSGVCDERETQRYLFILEGQKLVSPLPEGDFTSRSWALTAHGVKALKTIVKSNVVAF